MLIDHFFTVAIPAVIIMGLVAWAVIKLHQQNIISFKQSKIVQKNINKLTKTVGIMITCVLIIFYMMVVYDLFITNGAKGFIFSFVISIFLLIPFATVGGVLTLAFSLIFHVYQKMSRRT